MLSIAIRSGTDRQIRGWQGNATGLGKDEDQGYSDRGGPAFADVETRGGLGWQLGGMVKTRPREGG